MTKRKLPVQQLFILAVCRFAEPIALTSLFPYLPEMIESFNVPKNEIAKWAGVTSALFSLSQCATAIAWGRASDAFGRKPVILLGLFNTMITGLIFGFSTSLPMAIVARALSGAGNGNVGIIRTMVAELCPWKELQPRAFSIMPLVYNIGSVFGPTLGGALSNPYNQDPTGPKGKRLLERFPYALPNIVSACIFIFGITVGILYLRETLESRKHRLDYGVMVGEKISSVTDRHISNIIHAIRGTPSSERQPLLKTNGTHAAQHNGIDEETPKKGHHHHHKYPPKFSEVLTKQSCINLVVYTILAMHSIGYDQLIPVFMHHPAQDQSDPSVTLPFKFAGGFGIGPRRIGLMFTLYGVATMLLQIFVFPPVARIFGVLRCLHACFITFPIVFIATPFTALIPSATGKQIALMCIMLVKGTCSTFSFPCSTILLTNSAKSVRILGTLNGIATSVSAIGRAAGPAVGGAAFSLGAKRGFVIAPFWIFAAIAILGLVPAFFLVEGEGFGDDADDALEPDADAPGDADDDEDDEESSFGSSGEDEDGLVEARRRAFASAARSDAGSESEYGEPAPLLSRTSTVSSAAAVSMTESEDEAGGSASGAFGRMPSYRRGSAAGASPHHHYQRIRRRSSAPIGMGRGFRRLSSNLGQSMSGLGPGGGSFGGQ
ncbi:major facilitator superfamily domain-containing protein [Lineolata rhizophorae]|uniref:Major facilitator superfamily domain-containing protein n=1 Tax=Lineolata rhizophorae TaxID=578093 RepID=A0A6A6P2G8_9PEZI|nr:major facilitator superfamily domain-containing protein [Lineolata rhizophorae]